jgi:hypothetical protein
MPRRSGARRAAVFLPDINIYSVHPLPVFYVYVNKKKQRVLITRERIRDPQWHLAGVHPAAANALRHGRFIADARDYVLEWDLLSF